MATHALVFGAFDGLHEGHLRFLEDAHTKADQLSIALATDDAIRSLKRVHPHQSYKERSLSLRQTGVIHHIAPSEPYDDYQVIRNLQPDLIIFGHDQEGLKAHLLPWLKEHKIPIETITLAAHKPDEFKTSKLYDRRKVIP